jgi:hypothetical protein
MRLVLSGHAQAGLMVRSGIGGPPDSMAYIPGLSLYLRCSTIPGGYFYATAQAQAGQFSELSAVFVSSEPVGHLDPGALLGAEIHGELFTDYVFGGWWEPVADSVINLTEVRIDVTGQVPDEGTSWGAVQALYR